MTKNRIKRLMEDPICKEWIMYCAVNFDEEESTEWFTERQKFWEANRKHLEDNKLYYDSSLKKTIDSINCETVEDLEGALLIVKVGNADNFPSPDDIENTTIVMNDLLENIKGMKLVVVPYYVNFEKISLPKLREIESAIYGSYQSNKTPILDIDID